MTPLGATLTPDGATFAVWSSAAERLWLCLFDGERETERIPLRPRPRPHLHRHRPRPRPRRPLRPPRRRPLRPRPRFDPQKLLLDPYATAIDRPFAFNPRLAAPAPRSHRHRPPHAEGDRPGPPPASRASTPGFQARRLDLRGPRPRLHPPPPRRARPPCAAPSPPSPTRRSSTTSPASASTPSSSCPSPPGSTSATSPPSASPTPGATTPSPSWPPTPASAPAASPSSRATVATLRAAGIGTILDVVFNHTGEGDAHGPTLSLRGLDARAYFRHTPTAASSTTPAPATPSTATTPPPAASILDSLRHFVGQAGVDGFRFDLAPILGRTADGFDPQAETLTAITTDPLLADRILIAEPWDIGPGGYQLGRFPAPWLEWNDRFRDRARRFWRGDAHMLGDFATALAGSSDTFAAARHPHRQLHRRPRRLHPRRPHRPPPQAQPRQRRAQPRRPRREPLLEQRRRGPHLRPRRPRRPPPRPARPPRHPLRLPRHASC